MDCHIIYEIRQTVIDPYNFFKAPESAKPDIMVKDREAYSRIDNSSF
jgi:hypothetical protein